MLSLQASFSIPLITFYLSLLNCVNLNSALDSDAGLCTPYPCNQPPQPPSSTGYSPYGNPPPPPSQPSPSSSPPSQPLPSSSLPPPPRSRCPPVPTTGCCNQPPSSTMYSPPYPYFYTPPYPYGTLGGGQNGGGQGGGGYGGGQGTGAAMSYYSSSVPVYVLIFVLSYAVILL